MMFTFNNTFTYVCKWYWKLFMLRSKLVAWWITGCKWIQSSFGIRCNIIIVVNTCRFCFVKLCFNIWKYSSQKTFFFTQQFCKIQLLFLGTHFPKILILKPKDNYGRKNLVKITKEYIINNHYLKISKATCVPVYWYLLFSIWRILEKYS